MKRCTKCGHEKAQTEFYKDSASKDGLCYRCRECQRQSGREYYLANSEQLLAKSRHRNRDPVHRERSKSRDRERYLAKRELISAMNAKWRAENRSRAKALDQARYAANPERFKHNAHRWYRDNIDRAAMISQRKRARRLGADHDLTAGEWKLLKDEFGQRCAYCGEKPVRLTQDHMQPLTRGGHHTYENVVPACLSCNSRKSTKTLATFMAFAFASLGSSPAGVPTNARVVAK